MLHNYIYNLHFHFEVILHISSNKNPCFIINYLFFIKFSLNSTLMAYFFHYFAIFDLFHKYILNFVIKSSISSILNWILLESNYLIINLFLHIFFYIWLYHNLCRLPVACFSSKFLPWFLVHIHHMVILH